jgi:hypothetical protein
MSSTTAHKERIAAASAPSTPQSTRRPTSQSVHDLIVERNREDDDAVVALLRGEATTAQAERALKHIEDLTGLKSQHRALTAARAEANLPPLTFYTPTEIGLTAEPEPNWIIAGFFAPGTITEIDGKVKKSGKTTFLLAACKAVLDGDNFVGQRTRPTSIVYVTEQDPNSFYAALKRAGLADYSDRLHVLFRKDMKTHSWTQTIEACAAKCSQMEAEWLILDTFAKLADVRQENDAEGWGNAFEPLHEAKSTHNLSITVARHSRKSDAEVGDAGRGSSAASGEPDIILDLRRPEGNVPTTRRILQCEGRYSETTPDKVVIEFDPPTGTYKFLGTDTQIAVADAAAFVSAQLEGEFGQNESGLTMKQLEALGTKHEPPLTRTSIQRGIDHQSERNLLHSTGAGVKGNPVVFVHGPAPTRSRPFATLEANSA